MNTYQPDDFDLMVWTDKLRERVAFQGRIERRRPTLIPPVAHRVAMYIGLAAAGLLIIVEQVLI